MSRVVQKRYIIIAMVPFILTAIIAFSGCKGKEAKTGGNEPERESAGLSNSNGNAADEPVTESTWDDETGSYNMSGDSVEPMDAPGITPSADGFVHTQEQPLAPPAGRAEGIETVPDGELGLVVSIRGTGDPVQLVDGASVEAADTIKLLYTIVNNTGEKQVISFITSQKQDAIFSNDDGTVVFQWSTGIRFAQVLSTIELEAGDMWSNELTVKIGEGGIEPGTYNITSLITGLPELKAEASNVRVTV